MKLLILSIFILLLSCNTQPEKKGSVVSSEAVNKADSLKTVADSIANARNMHMKSSLSHLHQSGDNLATVAHQDPARDRMIRANISKNRELRLTVSEQQQKAMAEVTRKEREKLSAGVI